MAATGDTAPPADYHYLGKLGRTYQLAGGLRFYPAGELEADALLELDRVFVAGLGPTRIRDVRVHGGDLLVYLSRVTSREQAQRWVNAGVYADPDALPEPTEAGFYLDDLIGLPVERLTTTDASAGSSVGAGRGAGTDAGTNMVTNAGTNTEAYRHRAGEHLGEVSDLISAAGHDILVVDGPKGRLLLPLQAPYVEFDETGVRVIDPPEGLLD